MGARNRWGLGPSDFGNGILNTVYDFPEVKNAISNTFYVAREDENRDLQPFHHFSASKKLLL